MHKAVITLTAVSFLALSAPATAEDVAHAICQKGFILKKKGKLKEALAEIDKCLKKNPKHYEGWYQKGRIQMKLKKYESAKTAFKKAIELKGSDPWFHSGLCGALLKLEEIDPAIKACKKAVELDKKNKNWEAQANLGLIYRQLKKYDAAELHYKKAIEISPDDVYLYNNLGVVYRKQKKYADAVKMFQKCIELEPKQAVYHLNLAVAFRAQEHYDLAIAEYMEATELDPKLKGAWWDLALCYQAVGKDDKALAALEKYLALVKGKNPLAEEKALEKIEAIKDSK
jgi:tetratricopeptide (TPR) repeat protein